MMSDDKLNELKDTAGTDEAERTLLRDSARLIESKSATLDAATLSHLHQARSAALQQKRDTQWNWMPLGGAVTAAALIAVVLQVGPDGHEPNTTVPLPQLAGSVPAEIDDFEMLASAADIELLEDLEFYMWLDSDEGVGA